jgi:hypothetical protein
VRHRVHPHRPQAVSAGPRPVPPPFALAAALPE